MILNTLSTSESIQAAICYLFEKGKLDDCLKTILKDYRIKFKRIK